MSFWSKIWGNIKTDLGTERHRSPVAKFNVSQSESSPEPTEGCAPSLAEVYAAQILQFLTNESTHAYEQQNNAWWSEDDLRAVLFKAGFHNDVSPDEFTAAANQAIKSLWDTRRIVGTPSGCRAASSA